MKKSGAKTSAFYRQLGYEQGSVMDLAMQPLSAKSDSHLSQYVPVNPFLALDVCELAEELELHVEDVANEAFENIRRVLARRLDALHRSQVTA